MGHVLSPKPKKGNTKHDREKLAWEVGLGLACKHYGITFSSWALLWADKQLATYTWTLELVKRQHKYWNNQKFSECQLVTLWNAAIYHGLRVPERYGIEYYFYCFQTGSHTGSCIGVDSVYEELGIKKIPGRLSWYWVKNNCPAEFHVFCHRGYHSVLSVDVDKRRKRVLLANYARDRLHWIQYSKLAKMYNKHKNPSKLVPKEK